MEDAEENLQKTLGKTVPAELECSSPHELRSIWSFAASKPGIAMIPISFDFEINGRQL